MPKRALTTKDIALLQQLHEQGQLELAPEYQRNSVWPQSAKAYLIDTVLNDRPIPLLFFKRITLAQTGRPAYSVIDGQQRLRAIFEFLEDRYKLSQSEKTAPYYNKKFSALPREYRERILGYDLVIQEISGYDENDITDMFVRMNRYVVKLSPQELRHAKGHGAFHDFVEELGRRDFWQNEGVFSAAQLTRMRGVEYAAELAILIVEGPQDKKKTIGLYYGEYQKKFLLGTEVENRLNEYLSWTKKAIPNFSKSRFRKPVDLYSLVGALHDIATQKGNLRHIDVGEAGKRLLGFELAIKNNPEAPERIARYVAAASRQTDNITPRKTRIEIIKEVILG